MELDSNSTMEASANDALDFAELRKTCIITINGAKGVMSVDMYKIIGCCECCIGRA